MTLSIEGLRLTDEELLLVTHSTRSSADAATAKANKVIQDWMWALSEEYDLTSDIASIIRQVIYKMPATAEGIERPSGPDVPQPP